MPLLPDQTQLQYGYHPDSISPGSAKPVVYACDDCQEVLSRQRRRVHTPLLCHPCLMKRPRTQEWKTKFKSTMVERYGTPTALQNPDLLAKMYTTLQTKYGVHNATHLPQSKKAQKRRCPKTHLVYTSPAVLRKETQVLHNYDPVDLPPHSEAHVVCCCEYCENIFERSLRSLKQPILCVSCIFLNLPEETKKLKEQHRRETNIKRFGIENPFADKPPTGGAEDRLRILLEGEGCTVQSGLRLSNGKELDIVIQEKKLAIEYCGLRWHCDTPQTDRGRWYHHNKMTAAAAQGYTLLTIFEDEWLKQREAVWNYLISKIRPAATRLFARKCKIAEVLPGIAKRFLQKHHIQGTPPRFILCLGIYWQDELYGVMTFSQHHRQDQSDVVVLSRLAYRTDTCIVGGAGRMLKHALAHPALQNYKRLISWSDNRYSVGALYSALGFQLAEELPPDYSYASLHKPATRLSKQSQKKAKVKCPAGMTELQWAEQRGLARIWDCGKKRWELTLPIP